MGLEAHGGVLTSVARTVRTPFPQEAWMMSMKRGTVYR